MLIKNKLLLLLNIVFISLAGCNITNVKKEISLNSINRFTQENTVKAVLWQQLSGEYIALCYQSYNLAKLQLDNDLNNKKIVEKPLAIITDIDETVLDNSPFFGKLIKLNENYSKERWVEWGKQEKAESVPGALSFFKYAASKNIEIFYITNRYDIESEETISNLKKNGFPFADKEHILFKMNANDKEPRRNKVIDSYEVIMLMGDNLSDFSSAFDNNSNQIRNNTVNSLKSEFGNKFIVLPNPMYGDWESRGLYEGTYKWTTIQKDSIRKVKLISY